MGAGEPGGDSIVHGDVTNLIHVVTSNGGINLPTDSIRTPAPQQLPPEPDNFENQAAALQALDSPGPSGPTLHLLIGPPGSGKSATTLHWANVAARRFPGGRIYLDLRGNDPHKALDPHEALWFLLTSLGADPATVPADTDQRASFWRTHSFSRELLILLDNAADSDQIKPLLSTGPATVTLVTGRDALNHDHHKPRQPGRTHRGRGGSGHPARTLRHRARRVATAGPDRPATRPER
jgi:hypothetical protein